MKDFDYQIGDIVELKKPHPCSTRSTKFKILRVGADLKIECLGCGNILLISRDHFNKRLKRVIKDN